MLILALVSTALPQSGLRKMWLNQKLTCSFPSASSSSQPNGLFNRTTSTEEHSFHFWLHEPEVDRGSSEFLMTNTLPFGGMFDGILGKPSLPSITDL